MSNKNYKFETLQIHVGQEEADIASDARAVPVYQTTSYVFRNSEHAAARFGLADAGNIYGRLTNSTQDVFEKRIAALEGGVAALGVASGAAAVTYTIQNLAYAGDHIVSAKTIYGGTYNLLAHTLPNYGITTTFVDPDVEGSFEAAIQENTKAIFIETLGNPNSNIIDIEKVAAIAHAHKIPLVIDNTFATPYLVRPFEYGADIVIHSATKFIGGHGTAIGGVIVDSGKFDWEGSGKFASLVDPNPSYHGISFTKAVGPAAFVTKIRAILLRDTGASIAPWHAFLFLQGLETLSLRVERHVENALKVVEYLSKHPQVLKVNHPILPENGYKPLYDKYFPNGGGSIFTFEIDGDAEAAKSFIDHLEIFSLLANVADVKSLVIHPASTTHSQLSPEELLDQGIKPNTIRLSIGTEHIDDIIGDLDQAFAAVAKKPNLIENIAAKFKK
jgi:O-acetylhomoserine (thiol)-lyase